MTSYSFDKNGNLSTITYPSGRTANYAFDSADRPTTVTTKKGATTTVVATGISHKPYGGVSFMMYGNGLPRTVTYDQQYRIASIVTGSLQNVSYTHDPNGNITKITDAVNPTKTKSFGYDALDRLTSASGPWGSLGWTYDPVGNRQTQVENGATSTYSYQAGTNKLTGVSGPSPLTFSLDSNGNTTAENAKTYTYNQNNRLIKASESATLGEYTFNANGQRATKTAGGSTAVYHHDQSGNLIAETTSAGATVGEYVWLENQPLAKLDSGGTRYVHPDHLGTPQVMTSSTGTVVWQIEAKPFGDGASISGSASLNLRFPGQYYDSETGLHQNWFRDYSGAIGRYLRVDPLNHATVSFWLQDDFSDYRLYSAADVVDADPFGIHKPERFAAYVYAANNPLTKTDSTGLWSACLTAARGVGAKICIGQDPCTGGNFVHIIAGVGIGLSASYSPGGGCPCGCSKGGAGFLGAGFSAGGGFGKLGGSVTGSAGWSLPPPPLGTPEYCEELSGSWNLKTGAWKLGASAVGGFNGAFPY